MKYLASFGLALPALLFSGETVVAATVFSDEIIPTNDERLIVIVIFGALFLILPLLILSIKLHSTNKQLRLNLDEQGRMLKTFAHEYRTPVAIINAGIDFLEQQEASTPNDSKLEFSMMRRAVHRLVSLVDNSLRNERISAYVENHKFKDSCDLVEVLTLTRDAYLLLNPGRVDLNLGGATFLDVGIPHYELTTCIENLVENSLKFSGNTPISIELKSNGTFAYVSISDKGIGIPEDELGMIFNKYHRGRNAETTVGMGLGLYLTKKIIDQSGGEITVESRLSEYTRFNCKLPLVGRYDR